MGGQLPWQPRFKTFRCVHSCVPGEGWHGGRPQGPPPRQEAARVRGVTTVPAVSRTLGTACSSGPGPQTLAHHTQTANLWLGNSPRPQGGPENQGIPSNNQVTSPSGTSQESVRAQSRPACPAGDRTQASHTRHPVTALPRTRACDVPQGPWGPSPPTPGPQGRPTAPLRDKAGLSHICFRTVCARHTLTAKESRGQRGPAITTQSAVARGPEHPQQGSTHLQSSQPSAASQR